MCSRKDQMRTDYTAVHMDKRNHRYRHRKEAVVNSRGTSACALQVLRLRVAPSELRCHSALRLGSGNEMNTDRNETLL